ncbi:hypothetical protein JCM11641_001973 [Rhodosporidiobolus odoratus]
MSPLTAGAPTELSSPPPPPPPLASTLTSTSASTPSSPSLLTKVRRTLSSRKNSLKDHLPLPKALRRDTEPAGSSRARTPTPPDAPTTDAGNKGYTAEPEPLRAYTIAPPDHRENTTLHALLDSLPSFPSLPTVHTPSLPSFPSFPSFPFPSRGANSTLTHGALSGADEDSDADDSPINSPPLPSSPPPSSPPPPQTPKSRLLNRRVSASDPSGAGPPPSNSSSPFKPSFPSCSSTPSNDHFDRLYGNVIMLGGFRGSVLRDAHTGRRVWATLRIGFGIRKADLGLGLEDDDEMRSEETVVPGKMLCQVAGLVDLGKRLKEKLKSLQPPSHPSATSTFSPFSSSAPSIDPLKPPVKFHSFGYDWRRSLELSSAKLLEFLVRLKEESAKRGEGEGGKGVGATVIAHSMGGLVLLHALSLAPDPTIIRGIIFAGTPFQGCVNVLGALKLGGAVPRNPNVGSPHTVFSWRSSFYFLPRGVGRGPVRSVEEEEEEEQGEEELESEQVIAQEHGEVRQEAEETLAPPVGTVRDSSTLPPQGRSRQPSSSSSSSSPSCHRTFTTSTPSTSRPPSPIPVPPSTNLDPETNRPCLQTLLNGCFETPSGESIRVDFFEPSSWARCGLSPVTVGMDLRRREEMREEDGEGREREGVDEGEGEGEEREGWRRRITKSSDVERQSRLTTTTKNVKLDQSHNRENGESQRPRQGSTERHSDESEEEGVEDSLPPIAPIPGNLGERPVLPSFLSPASPASPIGAAASGVRALEARLDKLASGGVEGGEGGGGKGGVEVVSRQLREEEERLARQAKEEDTVRRYLERSLGRAEQFHHSLQANYRPSLSAHYPPIAILSSRSTPTVRGVLSTSASTIITEGYDRLLWGEGDGIVLFETATRLPGDPEVWGGKRGRDHGKWQEHLKGVVESQNGHVSLLGDLDGVRKCLELLYG